jgi:hypothetical protein
MGGVFLGFLCALALLAFLGRLRAARPPSGLLGLACWILVALTALDGLNAFLFDGNLPHLYSPNTLLRLLTGLGAGLGLGLQAVPVVASVIWVRPEDDVALDDPIEFGAGLAVLGLLGALILAGVAPLLWPIALLMLLSVLAAFGVANLYVLVLATGRARQAVSSIDLRGVLIAAVGLGLLELAGLSYLRAWLVTSYGFTWGV